MNQNQQTSRKNNKTRRETAVQGTNDSSIVSKCSTSTCGYFNDTYLKFFVSKTSRRAPLIHRGYYIRAAAFDRILRNFLEQHEGLKKQIISLGCGFDSTYFRLKAFGLLESTVFFEVDFPELVRRKRMLIEDTEDLFCLLKKQPEAPASPHIELSCEDYHLLGVDLTQLNTLEAALKMCALDFDCPTLLFSECVMTYMTRRCSTDLVKWAAETFEHAVFGMYEQINPSDAFGLFMQNHFHSIGSPLKCINAFPSLEAQVKRFLNAGWSQCEAMDMNQFYYQCLPRQEQDRIEALETFDEYEELNLKFSHYFILTAFTEVDGGGLISSRKVVDMSNPAPGVPGVLHLTRLSSDLEQVRRFGHCSSLVSGRCVLTTGGFGELDGRHQRLVEMTITDLNSLASYHIPCSSSITQYSRMHHASVTLSDGTTLLIAGRQSPYFMCSQMLKVFILFHSALREENSSCVYDAEKFSGDVQYSDSERRNNRTEDGESSIVISHPHNKSQTGATALNDGGRDRISLTNSGESCKPSLSPEETTKTALPSNDSFVAAACKDTFNNDRGSFRSEVKTDSKGDQDEELVSALKTNPSVKEIWSFPMGHVAVSVVEQRGSVPMDRWRHAAVSVWENGHEKVFLHGGKRKSGDVLEDTFLFDPSNCTWEQLDCCGDIPGPCHSHCLSFWSGHVLLSGGLDAHHSPVTALYLLHLESRKWTRMDISGNLHPRYSHTAHVIGDHLIMIGGVNLSHPPPGVAVVNLLTQTSTEFALPAQDKDSLLMFHRHSSVVMDGGKILVFGGGGNCFSFGTHLNRSPLILNLDDCLAHVQ